MTPDHLPRRIFCGMYAFTAELKKNWRGLFENLNFYLPGFREVRLSIRFDGPADVFHAPDFLLGHTCGYPYVTRLHETHDIVCVPEFDIDGCDGIHYSSWIITRSDHPGKALADFKNTVAVINNSDSNSGMNVLRCEISRFAGGKSFFSKVLISHSHAASIGNVIDGSADIAAIDAVTWHFVKEQKLSDLSKLRIIRQSIKTPGLPFVKSKENKISAKEITDSLNQCLEKLSKKKKQFLKIKRFIEITDRDYQPVLDLEQQAVKNHYPFLK